MRYLVARTLLVGLSSGCFLLPAKAQEFLFADNFNRPDNTGLNASSTGKSGTFGALDWTERGNSGSPEIACDRLQFG